MTITIRRFGEATPGDPWQLPTGYYICDTVAERDTITPQAGYVAYCKDTSRYYAYINATWNPVVGPGDSHTIEARTSDPVSPVVGQMWLRTDL